ncbi:hypothetical protein FOC4_g10009248 [Fusarium odoratissimum]|uniref:Uncharacterized protein n=1 Tax=Fusarium oxysporum f. sp. cubense (strain race 4) TaxID=2502994 RepID=N1RY69_FUSC4|nr:hypothetical protein FOC4_g10009248 [Fusarium odoratissimum]
MAPHQESGKPDKFGPTRPSSPSPPGATEVKVKEEIVSPSATNFLPWGPTPRTTKSLGDYPRRSDPQPYTAAWAPPNANLSQPYQPSAVPLQAPTMTFPPPTVPYQPPPVPFTYSAALNRYLNSNEVSGAQNSISQRQNNDQLKHMLERYQAIARSIRWNAEQLDRMIASLLGPLP